MKIVKHKHNKVYDLMIWGIGYESRSTHLAELCTNIAAHDVAFGYHKNNNVCSYQICLEFFRARGSVITQVDDHEFNEIIYSDDFVETIKHSNNILLDITVFTRKRIASLIVALTEHMASGTMLTISYSPSKFVPAPVEYPPISVIGPLHDKLNGEIGDLSKPSAMILGVGYEPGKASGIFSYLDCELTYLLYPKSTIDKFELKVKENNRYIFESIPHENIFPYNLEAPLLTYSLLKDLVDSCSDDYRTVIVPLGPKILTALSVIIGLNHRSIPVWRVSSEHSEEPVDRIANGKTLSFSLMTE